MRIPERPNGRALAFILVVLVTAVVTAAIAALLINISTRKQEAKNPYLKLVEVTENDVDPAKWGVNWPREYDGYKRTGEPTRTKYGGGVGAEGEAFERELAAVLTMVAEIGPAV